MSNRPQRIWGEFLNEEQETFFLRVNESKIPLEFAQEPIYDRENIPHEDRIIWLDDEMNAIEAKKNALLKKKKDQEKQKAEEKARDPKSKSKVSELFRDVEPQVKEIPKYAWKSTKEFDLDYVLPKISHLPQANFSRWLEKSGKTFVNDPKQNLNVLVTRFIKLTKLIPFFQLFTNEKEPESTEVYGNIVSRELNIKSVAITSENAEQFIKFIKETPFFIFAFSGIDEVSGEIDAHAILMKRENATTMTITDSNGLSWIQNSAFMFPVIQDVADELFTLAGFTLFPNSTCKFQTGRGTCILWSFFFALYPERTPEQLLKMIDDVVKIVGLPMKPESRNAVIMEIFYQFIQLPVKTQDVENLEEYRKGLGKLKGGEVPEELNFVQQMAKQSYNITDPKENINGWILKKWTPTMKFWMKGKNVIVGVRGTKTTEDVMTWGTVPLNTLDTTIVYKRDKAAVQQFQQEYPQNKYTYYAVGHSLGGAIIDNLIRAGLIKEAISYNSAIQTRDINAGLLNRRIYYGNDPLYRIMGWLDRKSEHREAKNRTWNDFLYAFTIPGSTLEALSAHNLDNFEGGVIRRKK